MLGANLKLASIVLVAVTGSFVAGAVVSSRLTSPATEEVATSATISDPDIATEDQAGGVADSKDVSPTSLGEPATSKLRLDSSFSRLIGFRPSVAGGQGPQGQAKPSGMPPGLPDNVPPGPPDNLPPGLPAETPPVNPPGSPFIP